MADDPEPTAAGRAGQRPQGTEVDELIERLEALTVEERAEISTRLALRVKKRGEYAP